MVSKILIFLLFTIPVLAAEESNIQPNESISFSGAVEAIIGHSFGYVSPEKGATFQIDLSELPSQTLSFGNSDSLGKTYIPLSADLKIITVNRYNNKGRTPSSIRLVSESKSHKVTIDVINNSGGEIKNVAKMWIIIESKSLIIGVWHLVGDVTYKQFQ
mgnify:CR=1 FL=1